MKWAIVLVLLGILNSQNIQSQNSEYQKTNPKFSNYASFGFIDLNLPVFINLDALDNSRFELSYKKVADLVAVGLLIISTIFVVITPLLLMFFWVYYSLIYVKKFRHIFSIKKWLTKKGHLKDEHFQTELWRRYRKVYSNMLGFGVSIIAYTLFAIKFMSSNFDRMEIALASYLSYPFKIMGNLKSIALDTSSTIEIDYLWDEMFIIVILSFVFYLLGWLIGSLLVDYRFSLINKKIPDISKKPEVNKEMFYLKLNKEIESKKQLKAEQLH